MNFFTHIMFSKELYRQLSHHIELDKKSFCYGNIKPDLSPKCLRNPHLLENYLFIVANSSNRLITEKNPDLKEFSVDLGIICHYICDFFCYYHVDSKLYHHLLDHFLYEIRLHWVLCSTGIKNKLDTASGRKNPGRSIASMIMEMRKEYMSRQKTFQSDIEYALLTSLWACELISHFSTGSPEPALHSKPAAAAAPDYIKASYNPCRV
jgi:hypothetical protein